jgi:hypothetical protein
MQIKCKLVGNKISRCYTLQKALEYGNPSFRQKGCFVPERANINTGEPGIDIVQLHSGDYVGRGIAMNFCPFCGENIKSWESKE